MNYESETEFTLSFLALPPGYQWEIWRKRKKRMESFSQVHTENDRAKMRFGHYVLYDRLALGETVRMVPYYGDKDIPHHAPSIRFAVFNNGTGARSFLSSETVVAQGRNIVKVVA